MPIVSSGAFGLYDVNIVLHRSGTATISLNDSEVRTMAGAGGSGTIIYMNDLHGKTKYYAGTYASYLPWGAFYYTGYYAG